MQTPSPIYIIGDIHGHLKKLVKLLEDAQLIDARHSWKADKATLWFLGDFVDRGPEGIAVLDMVMRLQAEAAGVVGLADAAAITAVDQRVSDLDDYEIESENDVFFDRDSAVLKEEVKPALADLAKLAKSLQGYLIEISGYTSNALGSKTDQKLSEERAAAVARYFYEVQNIPMRRILMPVGYGSTHRLASNTNAEGRELNRRVDVKVLINKSMGEGL